VLPKEKQKKICKYKHAEKGLFANRELVGILKRSDSAIILWRQFYTQSTQEFLSSILLVKVDGGYEIDMLMDI
jgi:hypothetical protein